MLWGDILDYVVNSQWKWPVRRCEVSDLVGNDILHVLSFEIFMLRLFGIGAEVHTTFIGYSYSLRIFDFVITVLKIVYSWYNLGNFNLFRRLIIEHNIEELILQ